MPRTYLKKATLTAQSGASDVQEIVQGILSDIEAGGDAAAVEYAAKFDKYDGNIILTGDEIQAACERVPDKLKQDIAGSLEFAIPEKVLTRLEEIAGMVTDLQRQVLELHLQGEAAWISQLTPGKRSQDDAPLQDLRRAVPAPGGSSSRFEHLRDEFSGFAKKEEGATKKNEGATKNMHEVELIDLR